MTRIEAPFTAEQVANLNAYQASGRMHPFTCVNRQDPSHDDGDRDHDGILEATEAGWVCRFCDYTQDWAHEFMADGSW